MRRSLFALASLLLVASPAFAQTVYSWEDKDGMHYTDDPSQVPKKAKVGTEQMAVAPVAPKKAVVDEKSAPAAAPAPVPAAPAPADPYALERTWRNRFIDATRRITSLKQNISALEATVPTMQTCLPAAVVTTTGTGTAAPTRAVCNPNPAYEQAMQQLALKRNELKDAEADLDQLDHQATREAVPREWRRGW
ncbi:MAG: DUF4124 domain-containing protein [Myxococcaceae bacterium]